MHTSQFLPLFWYCAHLSSSPLVPKVDGLILLLVVVLVMTSCQQLESFIGDN